MTRDQIAELQSLATEVQRWIQAEVIPADHSTAVAIRRLAVLANIAANELEIVANMGGRR